MHLTVIINSVVCALGAVVGALFAGASIVSIANMRVSWAGLLVVAALLVPVAFVVSGVGAWLAYWQGSSQAMIVLVALPWFYGVVFVILMLVSFKQ
jgi:hypothetical protein